MIRGSILRIQFSNQRSRAIARRAPARPPMRTSDGTRVNDQIRAREIRVISATGEQLGIMPVAQALQLAEEQDLDLVEVAPNATPPVCRMMDYGKYLYEKQKRERESRKAQKQIEIKEVRLRPKTDEHDIQVVLTKIRKFAKEGAKIRVRIRFRGREIAHPEVARDLMKRVAEEVADVVAVEAFPSLDGRSMIMVLAPSHAEAKS
ncbi:MAG: translation initiation factor IF-3 [Caldilineaceae bacterium]|nr:translation initiation factor IF-3 [Caldilineaceae bacterium]